MIALGVVAPLRNLPNQLSKNEREWCLKGSVNSRLKVKVFGATALLERASDSGFSRHHYHYYRRSTQKELVEIADILCLEGRKRSGQVNHFFFVN